MEKTTCQNADSVQAYKCQTEEQCDDCFMVDHLKECTGCEPFEHEEKMSIEEYDKTWFYKIMFPWEESFPKGWIVATPFRVFGRTLWYVVKVAKENYPWNKDI